jgi:acyl dehydratase
MAGPVRYWEDLEVGQEFQLGSMTFTRDEIVAFARDWDPQYFHVDAEAAKASEFGGLIASGFHTGSAAMRLVADGWLNPATSIGSPGLDELRWLKPVRPGDTISVALRVLEKRASQSKPHLGISVLAWTVTNQHGEAVMTVKAVNLIRRRPGDTR